MSFIVPLVACLAAIVSVCLAYEAKRINRSYLCKHDNWSKSFNSCWNCQQRAATEHDYRYNE